MAYLNKKSTVQIEMIDITDRSIIATVSEYEATELRNLLTAMFPPPKPEPVHPAILPDLVDPLLSKKGTALVNAHLSARVDKKIDAIKFLREATGCGLKDAKDAIECHIANVKNTMPPIRFDSLPHQVQKYVRQLTGAQGLVDVIDELPF